MTAGGKRALSIAVLAVAVAAALATFLLALDTQRTAPPHTVAVVGDPAIADGPGVLKGMEQDAAANAIPVSTTPSPGNLAGAAVMLVWMLTGILILTRQPGNKAGWVFLAIGVAWIASSLAVALVVWDARTHPGTIPLRAPLAVIGEIGVAPIILLPLLFLLFPDGRPPSPRWRWAAWALIGGGGLAILGTLINPGPLNNFVGGGVFYQNPAGIEALAGVAPALIGVGTIAALGGAIASVFGVRSRFKRSTGEERQQLRWLVTVATVALAILILGILAVIGTPKSANDGTGWFFVSILISLVVTVAIGIPAAYLIAIFRYGLWDLDVVIKKTAVAFILTVLIVSVGAFVIFVPGQVAFWGGNEFGVVVGFLVGLLAWPGVRLSRWIASRVVYGRHSSPYDVLSSFADRVGEAYSSEDVLPRMATVLGEGTKAEAATVWIALAGFLRPASTWPIASTPAPLGLDGDSLPTIEGQDAVEVRHQGELLGALSVRMPANDPMNPSKDKLVRDLASQAGLVLRNVRLIEELRASRQRLVAAQDEERRKLERNLHDGAQQQLVALSVQLKLARTLVERDPAKAGAMLETLQGSAGQAIDDLRDLARGIYPPLLADKGLVVALEAQARRSPVPVTVESDGVGRYPQDLEAAVYFSCLEALNNVAKYADASAATISLVHHDGVLGLSVADDGLGFDPSSTGYGTGLQGMADRLDAIGGRIEVESTPGHGTTIRATVQASTRPEAPA